MRPAETIGDLNKTLKSPGNLLRPVDITGDWRPVESFGDQELPLDYTTDHWRPADTNSGHWRTAEIRKDEQRSLKISRKHWKPAGTT